MADPLASRNGHDRGETARHDSHDVELVAGLVMGDLAASEARRAEALTRACELCGALARDLETIQTGLRATASWRMTAPRDFRLSQQDAARLRGRTFGAFLEQLRAAFAPATRPLGASLATLGLIGILVAAVGPALPGIGSVSAPQGGGGAESTTDKANASTVPAAGAPGAAGPGGAFGALQSPGSSDTTAALSGPAASGNPAGAAPAATGRTAAVSSPAAPLATTPPATSRDLARSGDSLRPWLLGGSALILLIGLGLLAWRPRGRSERPPGPRLEP